MSEQHYFADLHVDSYLTFKSLGADRYLLSMMLRARSVSDPAHWWVRDVGLNMQLVLNPAVTAMRADLIGAGDVTSEIVELPESLTTHGTTEQVRTEVAVPPMPPESMALVEFEIHVPRGDQESGALGVLFIKQDFGVRRLDDAAIFMALVPLLPAGPEGDVRIGQPRFEVMCDEAEDGAPGNETYLPEIYYNYDVAVVPGLEGPCSHDWCLGTLPE